MNLLAWDPIDNKMGVVDTYHPKTGKVMFENDTWDWYKRERIVRRPTGLKDENGKEIYEGDVCEVEYKSGKKFNNDIRFLNAAFTFRSYYLHRVAEDVLDEFCTIRVVGNIYENPELLEAKHD